MKSKFEFLVPIILAAVTTANFVVILWMFKNLLGNPPDWIIMLCGIVALILSFGVTIATSLAVVYVWCGRERHEIKLLKEEIRKAKARIIEIDEAINK